MNYVKQEDYEYISGKYHDTEKPFDSFKRYIRRDDIFRQDSGMDPEMLTAGIWENDRLYSDLPHPVRKARAIEYVLKNTRISCDKRDIFPAINMVDRPLSNMWDRPWDSTLLGAWRKEVLFEIVPEVERRRKQLERDGIVTIWLDYDHTVPIWDRLLELGFAGTLAECERARRKRPLNDKEEAFFEGIRITYLAVIMFIERLFYEAEDGKMKTALKNLITDAPSTFYEALLPSNTHSPQV